MTTDTIITVIAAIATTVLGAWLTYKYQKRVSDRDTFQNWRNAFDRSAFKGKFSWWTGGTNIDRFVSSIQDLKVGLAQGTVKHNNPGNRGGSVWQVKNKEWRKTAAVILEDLEWIYQAAKDEKNKFKDDIATTIDQKRDKIIEELNQIWRHLKIEEMKLPTASGETAEP